MKNIQLLVFICLGIINSSFAQTINIQEVSKALYDSLLKKSYKTPIFFRNNLIHKKEDKFTIEIDNKPALILKDINDKEDETKIQTYSFIGFIDSTRTLLVFLVQEYESGYCLIINTKSGKDVTLWNEPIINQDRSIIVAFSNLGKDIENRENGFQIVKFEEDQFRKYEYNTTDKYPKSLHWINNNILLMSYTDKKPLKRGYLVITIH